MTNKSLLMSLLTGVFVPALIDLADLTPDEFRILVHLMIINDSKQGVENQSVKKIGTDCRIGEVTTRRILNRLENKGWILREPRFWEEGGRREDRIRLTSPDFS